MEPQSMTKQQKWALFTPKEKQQVREIVKTFNATYCEDPEGTYVIPFRPVRVA